MGNIVPTPGRSDRSLRHVSIESQGRCGTVTYRDAGRQLACYWEFGGDDVVAVVQCGSAADWVRQPWALEHRAGILQFIADEVVRQQAPTCTAQIDMSSGNIVLRQAEASSGPALTPTARGARPGVPGAVSASTRADEARWVFRLSSLRMKLGLLVLAAALLVGAGTWFKNSFLAINPGKGTAVGHSVRTDRHIATLIQTLEPYVPSLNRNHGNDRYGISLFLVPLDGSATRLVQLRSGLAPQAFGLARILGSDGDTLWFDVAGVGGVDLRDYSLRPEADVANVDPRALPRPWGDSPSAPPPERFLAAGLMTSPTTWLGLHSDVEVARDFRPGQWLRPIMHADEARQPRRIYLGQVEPAATAGYSRILGARAVDDAQYLGAAFLRTGSAATPIRLDEPPGALMLYTSASGPQGTAVVARVDDAGKLLWRADTGIDRFRLQQILPGEEAVAFVGTRPPVPDKVSEPLLVIVDSDSGRQVTHSLWR